MLGIPILGVSGLPSWDSGTKWHLDIAPMANNIEYYKGGRWWLSFNLGHGEFYDFVYVCDSFMHQKCSNYALTNLLFGLCKFVWIVDLLVSFPNPHPRIQARISYPRSVVN